MDHRWVRWIMRFRWQTFWGCLVATGIGLFLADGVSLDADMVALLGDEDEDVVTWRRVEDQVPLLDALFLQFRWSEEGRRSEVQRRVSEVDGVSSAFYLSYGGGQADFLAAILTSPASDIASSRRVLADLEHGFDGDSAFMGVTGTPAYLVESQRALNIDVRRAGIITCIAVLLFFVVLYRAGAFALLALLPVGVGIAWGLALASCVLDRLGLLAAMVPTLMIGIGIDIGLHMLQATRRLMSSGMSREEAVEQATAGLMRPILVCGVTTFLAFLGLASARLTGLREMGVTGACLTLGILAASILLNPILLSWSPNRWLTHRTLLEGFMARLAPWIDRHAWKAVATFGVVSVAAAWATSTVTWRSDQSALEPPDLEAKQLQLELSRDFGVNAAPFVMLCSDGQDMQRLVTTYSGDRDKWHQIAQIQTIRGIHDPLLLIHTKGNPFSQSTFRACRQAIDQLVVAAGAAEPKLSGSPVLNDKINRLLKVDGWRVAIISSLAVFAFLAWSLGNLTRALLALIPLMIGCLWMLGGIGVAGVALSLMTIAVAPLIVGLGVDDGVHVLHAWSRHRGKLSDVFKETGVAVVATTATTLAAFGAFALSQTPALVQFGLQALIGLTACMLASLTVLPLAARSLASWGGRHLALDEEDPSSTDQPSRRFPQP